MNSNTNICILKCLKVKIQTSENFTNDLYRKSYSKILVGEFSGSPVVRTFTAEGLGSIPGWGTKILQAVWCSQNVCMYVCMYVCVCIYIYIFWVNSASFMNDLYLHKVLTVRKQFLYHGSLAEAYYILSS